MATVDYPFGVPYTDNPCPTCGKCPTCGQYNTSGVWLNQWYPAQPYTGWSNTTSAATSAITLTQGG